MRISFKKVIALVLSMSVTASLAPCNIIKDVKAVNPIVQDVYTADPAPMTCSDGRLYVYTSHDEDETINGFFTMNDWKCYSTTDMVNWTDHGTVLSYHAFEWASDNSSWACQCIEKDGKFYMYVPINDKKGTNSIGVAVADSPTGPFTDALGEPLLGPTYTYIDPTVWIDTNGQAYLYWGNPNLYCVKLNDDMISYDKSLNTDGFVNGIKKWNLETSAFPELKNVTNAGNSISSGSYADDVSVECKQAQSEFGVGTRVDNNSVRRPTLYEEGPWFYGRNGKYYMVYAANGIPERIDYSMSDSPTGPWEYKGIILDENMEDNNGTGSFTNHAGVVDYKGHSYIFYHTGRLNDGGGYHRSVAIEEITYNEDGTIDTVPMTAKGVEPIAALNPYERVEAETIEYSNSIKAGDKDRLGKYGVEKEACNNTTGGVNLTDIQNGDYICIKNVDFTQYGAVKFTACTSSDAGKAAVAGKIIVTLDSQDGDIIAEYTVKGGDDENAWVTDSIDVDKNMASGIHDVYMTFEGDDSKENLFKFDYWQFTQDYVPTAAPSPTVTPAPITAPTIAPTAVPTPTVTPKTVKAPAKVKLISAKAGKKSMTLKWKKVSGANGYQIIYGTDKKFKKAVKKIATKKTSIKISKLKSKKIYYAKVCAYTSGADGKKVYGKTSAVAKIKVK